MLLLNLLILGATRGPAQPFQVGHTTITFTDPGRNNRSIATEIYYIMLFRAIAKPTWE